MKNREPWSLIKAALVMGIIATASLLYMWFSVFHAKMPPDRMHINAGSDYECLGCHNRARSGGSSLVYHFSKDKCRECHMR